MLFKQAYPDAKDGDQPIPERLLRTSRFFLCDVCRKVITPWRCITDPRFETPVCSDDCFIELEDRRLAETQEQPQAVNESIDTEIR